MNQEHLQQLIQEELRRGLEGVVMNKLKDLAVVISKQTRLNHEDAVKLIKKLALEL